MTELKEMPVVEGQDTETLRPAQTAGAYFAILVLGSILLLAGWVVLKFAFEHKLAGHNAAGYPGMIAGPAPDILFLGSSHTRQSYDIAAIEKATGHSAYLFAYSSLDQNFMDLILHQILPDPAHRPKLLVLEAYSAKLARRPDIGDYRLFFDVPPAFKLKILANYVQHHSGLSMWLDLFDLVVNRGSDQIVTYPLNSRLLADMSYKGSYRGHVMKGLDEKSFQSLSADVYGGQPDRVQMEALEDLIRLCKQYRVKVVMAESPMPQPTSSLPDIQNLKRVFREVAQQNDIPYLDGDKGFPINDPALFYDAGHVSTAGRERYTDEWIDWFKPQMAKLFDPLAPGPE